MDQTLTLQHTGGSQYRVALPAMPAGKWQLHLADGAATWRLSGIVHTPLSQPVTLSASTVQLSPGV
ncbi:MAG: hypothetical protein B7X81_14580 [Hydrogenophilales bacterium 17-61-76]|nr:MAG: hypothetical protein B7Y21_13825 [Hydrogenophilales bacterium 16-61-112]OZA40990.1 MAG: hypothetical protein B7X81_14580 [Hydrogenophilales bacterium 17-61-76]